jgi:hypothetical protein
LNTVVTSWILGTFFNKNLLFRRGAEARMGSDAFFDPDISIFPERFL